MAAGTASRAAPAGLLVDASRAWQVYAQACRDRRPAEVRQAAYERARAAEAAVWSFEGAEAARAD